MNYRLLVERLRDPREWDLQGSLLEDAADAIEELMEQLEEAGEE